MYNIFELLHDSKREEGWGPTMDNLQGPTLLTLGGGARLRPNPHFIGLFPTAGFTEPLGAPTVFHCHLVLSFNKRLGWGWVSWIGPHFPEFSSWKLTHLAGTEPGSSNPGSVAFICRGDRVGEMVHEQGCSTLQIPSALLE